MVGMSSRFPTRWLARWFLAACFPWVGLCDAPTAPTAARLCLDAQCLAPTANGRPLAPGNPSASTRRMAQELARIRATADPAAMAFLSGRLAEEYSKAYAETVDLRRRLRLGIELGVQQMQAGRPDLAIETVDGLGSLAAEAGGRLGKTTVNTVRRIRAISYLRVGEQENCIGNHRAESCLFPLAPEAFHKVERGSRNALAELGGLLEANPDDLGSLWLLNIAHMTLGEYPSKVPEKWRIPPSAFESEYSMPRYPNVAGRLGLDLNGLAGGVVADDFDNDGFLDLFVSEWSLDGQLRFFRSNGDGTFTDVTEAAGLLTRHPSQTGCWFDYDGDGWLDLFKGNETTDPADPDGCELFHNNRDGTFTECAQASGIRVAAFIKGTTWADYDGDGRPDLYLSNRSGPNRLLQNDGPAPDGKGWRFSDTTHVAGVEEPFFSFPTAFLDYDNDGREDLLVSGYNLSGAGDVASEYLGKTPTNSTPRLYRNLGGGRFENVTRAVHLDRVVHAMGLGFGDLDNDGWLDLYFATGDPDMTTQIPNRMFRNAGGKSFLDVTTATGTGHLQKGHGVTFADLDNDGDEDVYTVMGGAFTGDVARNVLFENPGNRQRWINLHLEGVKANRPGIGAQVRVVVRTPSGTRSLHRRVGAAASFGSTPRRLHVGLGDAVALESIRITWPGSGTVQELKDVPLDRTIKVREGEAVPSVASLPVLRLGGGRPAASADTALVPRP